MLPGTFSVIAVIACIILVASGWGSHLIMSSKLKRSYLIFMMLSFVLLTPYSIDGKWVQSITISGALLPCILMIISMRTKRGWKYKILCLFKGLTIGSASAGVAICCNQLFALYTGGIYWIAVLFTAGSSFIVCRSFLDRWGTALLAVETASVWIDVCVKYVPMEHLVIGSPITQDMIVAESIGVWLITSIVNEAMQVWTTGQVAIQHSRMKRT